MQSILFWRIVRVRVVHIMTMMLLLWSVTVRAEGLAVSGDSIPAMSRDSIQAILDSIQHSAVRSQDSAVHEEKKSELTAPVYYQSNDSMIMHHNGNAYLHGKGELRYENMELTSEYIKMNLDSSTIYAQGVYDSVQYEWIGKPVFKDDKDQYQTNEITYNIKTKKGYIRHVVTEQGEGYVIADRTKKTENDEMMMAGGQYTTCDDHDHPHFYLKMTKAKVKPGDYIATGPAYMVVGEVPLPLAIPFGFFPITKQYSSGLIMPSYGDDGSRGLYLNNLGYYFAINDYMDLEVTGDIYTKGTWAIRAQSKYVWRYHFSGNLSINFRNDVVSEKGMPDYAATRSFKIQWTHSQDSKFNPYCTFSASVNFSTSSYTRNNINNYYNSEAYSENTKSSTINYTQRFPDSPWSMSLTAGISQSSRSSTLVLTAPQLSINMTSVSPFKEARARALKRKGKIATGKEKWYEKIKMSYSMSGKVATRSDMKEWDYAHTDFARDWRAGMQHTIPISASFMLFKYLSVTPSISMTDRMYFQRVDQRWNSAENQLQMDTTTGFYNVFDFNTSLSFSTTIYGFFTPIKRLFPKSKVEKFRHVVKPHFSISYHPDFEKPMWGYYGRYTDGSGEEHIYNRYPTGPYGNAARGMSATLNFGVANNLEMKIVNKNDTTGKVPFKVISLIDNFSVDGGYNFALDSMNWNLFQVNLKLKFPYLNNYSVNLSTSLDPYMYEIINGSPRRTNKQYWHHGRFPHWSGLRWSFNYTFDNNTLKRWKDKLTAIDDRRRARHAEEDDDEDEAVNLEPIERSDDGRYKNAKLGGSKKEHIDDGYVRTEFPWSISVYYSLAYTSGSEFDYEKMYYKMIFTHSLSLSGSLGLGKGWKVSANMCYDFDYKEVTSCNFNISRDLHCWSMSASINPIGPFRSYNFHIGVNASILADLKYDKYGTNDTRISWW